jgi:FPC/CPF motif-containing protein YcgG
MTTLNSLPTLSRAALATLQQTIEERLQAYEDTGRLDSDHTSLVALWDAIEDEWQRRVQAERIEAVWLANRAVTNADARDAQIGTPGYRKGA